MVISSLDRILIADSDETILLTLANFLENEGYECTLALDGPQALQVLEDNEYDLLITEIKLSGNEDLELVWFVNQHAPEIPVIIYTGRPSLHSAITSIQLSVAAYLVKPVPFAVLLQHVKTSIDRRRRLMRTSSPDEVSFSGQDELTQIKRLTSAIQETIEVLRSTRSAFKSKKLAALRRKLERLIVNDQPE